MRFFPSVRAQLATPTLTRDGSVPEAVQWRAQVVTLCSILASAWHIPLRPGTLGKDRRDNAPRPHVQRHVGEPGHTRDTHGTHGRTRAHGSHRRTSQPSIQTHHTLTQPARRTRDEHRIHRNRGRLNSHSPGADRTPRPTQKRPPPANPTLPPPAPRAPPRACSKAVGEMKAARQTRSGRPAHFFDLGGPSHLYSGNYLIGFEHCGTHF
jgi:hypothetical protein